jgi:hypothetical protein
MGIRIFYRAQLESYMNLFTVCTPKDDVLAGKFTDNQYAADLSQVLKGTAPEDYKDPARFFANTYPTKGLREILSQVGLRLGGSGDQKGSIFRLDTQFGGGKTHSLIALVHALKAKGKIPNLSDFVNPNHLPKGDVRIFAFSGENSSLTDGSITADSDIRPKSIWGEMAYALGGRNSYELLRKSDETHISPGADILEKILEGSPVLLLIDEIAVYLRKAEQAHKHAAGQFTSFLQELAKTVSSSTHICLVFTLAISQDKKAVDAYQKEQEAVIKAFEEVQSVVARQATILNPTDDSETTKVIRTRLFQKMEKSSYDSVVQSYIELWKKNKDQLPAGFDENGMADSLRESYPFHPALFRTLTEKLSSLDKFQRTRGMLRLLARTVHSLWSHKPAETYAIHTHHIDLGVETIRDEVTSRLDQAIYVSALKADVSAVENDSPSTAQTLDKEHFSGESPLTEYLARTIFLNSLAYPESAKGISVPELKESILYPGLDGSFLEKARTKFIENSQYLDDKPNSPLRFLANPNLEQVVRKSMREFSKLEVNNLSREKIQYIFNGNTFKLYYEPQPHSLPDDAGEGKPYLAVFGIDQLNVELDSPTLPSLIETIFKFKGQDNSIRQYQNNLLFLVASTSSLDAIEEKVRRFMALEKLKKPEFKRNFPDHQQEKIEADFEKSKTYLALTIAEAYKHLYYPSSYKTGGFPVQLKHVVIDRPTSSNKPGDGQYQIRETLKRDNKIQEDDSEGDSPTYVVSKTMGGRGSISTLGLKNEYRKSPHLSMLFSDNPLIAMIQRGIRDGVFVYQLEDQVWGPGDPSPNIRIDENSFLLKMSYAEEKGFWPRPAPLELGLQILDRTTDGSFNLLVSVGGGIPPYQFTSKNIPELLQYGPVSQTSLRTSFKPGTALQADLRVVDSRGNESLAGVYLDPGSVQAPSVVQPPFTPNKPVKPTQFTSEGPLGLALEDLEQKFHSAKLSKLKWIRIRVYESTSISKLYVGSTEIKDCEKVVTYSGRVETLQVPEFLVSYKGTPDKFTSIKNFFEQQMRALGGENHVEADFEFTYPEGINLADDTFSNFRRLLSQSGGAEVYIEAEAKE